MSLRAWMKRRIQELPTGEYVCKVTTQDNINAFDILEPIVRCRDCRYMHTVRSWLGNDVDECWLHADRESGASGKERTELDGFCAWGERKVVEHGTTN